MAEEAKNKASASKFRTSIGGQALIEGVLMPRPGYALPASSFLISRISMYPFPFYVKG